MSNQYDADSKWQAGPLLSPPNDRTFPYFAGDRERDQIAQHWADEEAISAKLLRRCNNGRKFDCPR